MLVLRLILRQNDTVLVCQPFAGLTEAEIKMPHHEVDGAARGSADEASEGVLAHAERERGMMVVMKRAECLMPRDLHPHPFRDPLNREVAEPLNILSFHIL